MFAIQNLDWEKWFIRKYNSLWFFPFNFLYSCQIRLFLLDIMIFCLRDKTLVWENSCHFEKDLPKKIFLSYMIDFELFSLNGTY